MYHDEGYRGAIKALSQGKPIYTGNRVDRVYLDTVTERNEKKDKEQKARAYKVKSRI